MSTLGRSSSPAQAARALSLDALRGLAILMMVMSGEVPERALPAWMYHAQTPPPTHHFAPHVAGLTWVDLVFPFFLFAMGAAIPLALARRIEQGISWWRLVGRVLWRGFLLGFFALYIAHVRPWDISESPTAATWLLALAAFALLFPLLARLPSRWPRWLHLAVRAAGWVGVAALLSRLRYPDGSGFSVERSDIIIVLLTNTMIAGSLLWLVSRDRLLLRLGFMGMLMALRVSSSEGGWVGWLDSHSPLPWMFQLGYLQDLFIVLPGTIVGDLVLSWMRSGEEEERRSWPCARLAGLAAVGPVVLVAMLVCLQARWEWQAAVAAAVLCAVACWLAARPVTETEKLLKRLLLWGTYWLLLGLVFEAYEGGIKKDPATMSYYFVTAGLAIFLLCAFTIAIDLWRQRRLFGLLIANGQNPMIAYTAGENFVAPILAMAGVAGLAESLTPSPWLGVLRGAAFTLIVAVAVSGFTRLKVFWRT